MCSRIICAFTLVGIECIRTRGRPAQRLVSSLGRSLSEDSPLELIKRGNNGGERATRVRNRRAMVCLIKRNRENPQSGQIPVLNSSPFHQDT